MEGGKEGGREGGREGEMKGGREGGREKWGEGREAGGGGDRGSEEKDKHCQLHSLSFPVQLRQAINRDALYQEIIMY